MATTAYLWEARAKNGDVKKGVMEADSEEAVHNKLKLQLLSPVEVKKQPKQLEHPHRRRASRPRTSSSSPGCSPP